MKKNKIIINKKLITIFVHLYAYAHLNNESPIQNELMNFILKRHQQIQVSELIYFVKLYLNKNLMINVFKKRLLQPELFSYLQKKVCFFLKNSTISFSEMITDQYTNN